MLQIIDLSNVNKITGAAGPIIKRANITCAFLKVSEGQSFNDAYFSVREQSMEYLGIRVGGYHYAHPEENTPREEAIYFLSRYSIHCDRRSLKSVLDYESGKALTRMSSIKLVEWAREWNKAVYNELGHWPLFYSYPAYIDHLRLKPTDKTIGGGLWLASYGRNDGNEHPYTIPSPWKSTVAHQYTSHFQIPGIVGYVDMSSAKSLRPLLAYPFAGLF